LHISAWQPGAPNARPGAPLNNPGTPLNNPEAPLNNPEAPLNNPMHETTAMAIQPAADLHGYYSIRGKMTIVLGIFRKSSKRVLLSKSSLSR